MLISYTFNNPIIFNYRLVITGSQNMKNMKPVANTLSRKTNPYISHWSVKVPYLFSCTTLRKRPPWWSPFILQHPLHLLHLCNSVEFYCIYLIINGACCSCHFIFLTLSAYFLESYSILLRGTNSEIWIYRVIHVCTVYSE